MPRTPGTNVKRRSSPPSDPIGSAAPRDASRSRRTWWFAAAVLLAVLVGSGVRLATWERALGGEEPQLLGDTDPHYHVLRAHAILVGWPRVPDRDPGLNHPYGAEIPWPPLFDQLLAGATRAAGGRSLEDVARVAVFAPVLFGAVGILLAALACRALAGSRSAAVAALLVALLPASVDYGVMGRADQHVVELAILAAAVLLFVQGFRSRTRLGRRSAAAALGAVLALGLWNWLGAPLYLLVLALFVAAWNVFAARDDGECERMNATLAAGAGVAAIILVAVVLAFAPPGALFRVGLLGLSGMQPLSCALVAIYSGLLWGWRRRRAPGSIARRLAAVLGAGVAPLATALVLVPPFRAEAARGLVALLAGNPWYRSIDEFQPLLLGSRHGILVDAQYVLASFGLTVPAAVVALWVIARRMRRTRDDRAPSALLFLWTASFLVLTLASRRFALYLVVPLAITVAVGIDELLAFAARRLPLLATERGRLAGSAAAVAVLLAPTLPPILWGGESSHQPVRRDVQAQLRRLAAEPARPGTEGVLSSWTLGHAVRYYAGRPAVATPFGTEGGEGAMGDTAAFFLERDEPAAEELLRRRRIGHVLLSNPVGDWHMLQPFVPAVSPAVRTQGEVIEFLPGVEDVITARLFFADGGSTRGAPSLPGFRLVDETSGIDLVDPLRDTRVKLFELVRGARLVVRGAAPGLRVSAQALVHTAANRTFEFVTWGVTDPGGMLELRVPYATGENGTSRAEPYEVRAGDAVTVAEIPESAVRDGAALDLELGAVRDVSALGGRAERPRDPPRSLP